MTNSDPRSSAGIERAAEKIIEDHIRTLDIGCGDEFRIPDAIANARKEKTLAHANNLIGCIASWAAADIAKLVHAPAQAAPVTDANRGRALYLAVYEDRGGNWDSFDLKDRDLWARRAERYAELLAGPVNVREQFEHWALANVGQAAFAGKHIRGGKWAYNHNIMQLCWQCWQDASQPPAAPVETDADLLKRLREMPSSLNDALRTMEEAAARIEQSRCSADIERERDEARQLVTEANNSLYGSQGYFHSLNGGPFDKYHLSRGIEDLKKRLRDALPQTLPPTPHVEYVAARGQSKVEYWVSREEGDHILSSWLTRPHGQIEDCDCVGAVIGQHDRSCRLSSHHSRTGE